MLYDFHIAHIGKVIINFNSGETPKLLQMKTESLKSMQALLYMLYTRTLKSISVF